MTRLVAVLLICGTGWAASLEWPQFGGPHRNFTADVKGLPDKWPGSGPKKLWSRDLGEGYSEIAVDGPVLYTMCRRGEQEITVALATATGKTLWEHPENAAFRSGMGMENGPGPHATPLVTADHVYVIGILANLLCLDKKTGKTLWSHDLYREFNATRMDRGYSASPIAWKDTVIVKAGGAGHALIAFNQKDGKVVWQKQDFKNSPSSPVLIRVDGQDQVVAAMSDDIVGLNPDTGDLFWSHPHSTSWGLNISMPLWTDDNTLFVTSAYNGGCVAFAVARREREESGEGALEQQPDARAYREPAAHRRHALRVQRRLRPRAADRHGCQDRQGALAGPHFPQGLFCVR